MKRGSAAVIAGLMLVALFGFGQAALIHAKACLAPLLIAQSFHAARAGVAPPPWPWADARVAARLSVPDLGVERYLLQNDQPATLAFGPGLAQHRLGEDLMIVSGHRDTHFAFLNDLRTGMTLLLQTTDGAERRLRVHSTRVVDSRRRQVPLPPGGAGLVLLTCYPFNATSPGGPLRFVVLAVPAPLHVPVASGATDVPSLARRLPYREVYHL